MGHCCRLLNRVAHTCPEHSEEKRSVREQCLLRRRIGVRCIGGFLAATWRLTGKMTFRFPRVHHAEMLA